MKPTTLFRILIDRLWRLRLRHSYWAMAAFVGDFRCLWRHADLALRGHVRRDLVRYLRGAVMPQAGHAEMRARAAADWLMRSQAATPDDGASLGYFPCDGRYAGWRASYPETTGYIMTSLLRYARELGDVRAREAALRMGHWEAAVQMHSGAVQGGPVTSSDRQTAAAFNTGMVLDGWCSAYEESQDPVFLSSARRAADFLVADLDEQGYFRSNGDYVSAGEVKTYTCLCAWAMYRFGRITDEGRYCTAAVRAVEAALRKQQLNGWFANNCLTRSEAPLTHTLGYTLQGVLEVGLLAGRADFVAAAQRGLDPILARMNPDGYLPGRFYADWEPAALSSCLTGSAQIALVAYRLGEHTGQQGYADAADRLVNYLKALQELDSSHAPLNGALPGSFPLLGEYMRSGYPNWATKYFLDALLSERTRNSRAIRSV